MKVRLIDQKFIFLFMGIYYILFSRQRINCVKKIITKCTFHHHLKKLLGNTPAMCVLTVFEQNNSVLIHVYSSALCDEWFPGMLQSTRCIRHFFNPALFYRVWTGSLCTVEYSFIAWSLSFFQSGLIKHLILWSGLYILQIFTGRG